MAYKKSEKMRAIRLSLESGNCLGVAMREAGIKSSSTIPLWRKRGLIDRYFLAAIAKSDTRRNDVVVDSLFKQAKDGNTTAIAIWLKFKMGWKESYEGPPVNVYTQIWMGAITKAQKVGSDGRIIP